MARGGRDVLLEGLDEMLRTVSESAAAEMGQRVARLWEPLKPQPGRGLVCPYTGKLLSPQEMALSTAADETFFGGAPGGGKTHLLVGCALTQHSNSIIFRREYTQFHGEDGLIAQIDALVGLNCTRNGQRLIWSKLPGGRAVQLGGVKYEGDLLKWKGRPHDLKGFDELPEMPEKFYRFLIGWLRSSRPGQRTRVLGTGNPPLTEEGMWVIRYWAPWLDPQHPRPAKPGELRYYAAVGKEDVERPDGEPFEVEEEDGTRRMVRPRSRTFIPAALEDNPHYGEDYASVLDSLPEPMRSRFRFGNFRSAVEDHEWQVIPGAWVDAAQRRWRPDGGLGQPFIRAGCDPSRGGQDEFVVSKLFGVWVAPLAVYRADQAEDGGAGAALVMKAVGGDKAVPVQVDIIGTAGGSVFDHCRTLGLNVVAVNGSERSEGTDRTGKLKFANVRAELHWRMREALDPTYGSELALPPDPRLKADLCAPRWAPTSQGIRVEPKEQIKARIGRSPDRGEAVIYGCAGIAAKVVTQVRARAGILWGK